jgi:copper chaperone
MADCVLEISGMSCGNCVSAAKKALKAVSGVVSVEVTLDPPRAEIEGAGANPADLIEAVTQAGFTAVVCS